MPDMKNWLFEFIQIEDVVEGEVGEFVSIPTIDEDAEFESMTATILYKHERRKININKGNGRALAEAFGFNTDAWHHKKFTLHLPTTPDEKKSRMKYIIHPITEGAVAAPKGLTKEQRIEALRARGVSEEQLAIMEEVGAL